MKLVRSVAGVREALMGPREEAMRIGLVPTMGAFHEGHLTLFRTCASECDVAVASLFVNPAQFGPNEDLARYPRDLDGDMHLAEEAGIDLLFAPGAEEMYPPGFQTAVEITELGTVLEGASRPGHFRGVATVCLKLFNIVQPSVAYFGRKDAQQAAVIGTMLRDLNLPLELRNGESGCNLPYLNTGYDQVKATFFLLGKFTGLTGIKLVSAPQLITFGACLTIGQPTNPCTGFDFPVESLVSNHLVVDIGLGS